MILADTGFFVALVVRSDRHHRSALESARRYGREGLLTTWPVLTETIHLVQRMVGAPVGQQVLASIENGAAQLFDLTPNHLPRILELMEKYRDLPMDVADASLVICAEASGEGRILSTDRRDFGAYRWKERKPFKNLMKVR
jgi:predicted nucleic acid-binding protein